MKMISIKIRFTEGLRKRFTSGSIAALTLFLFTLVLFRQPIIEAGVHHRIEQGTGMKAELQQFNFSLREGEFWINNLKVKNPEGYHDDVMFDLPRVHAKQSHRHLFRTNRIDYLMLHFKRVYLIKNEKGQLNVHYLQSAAGLAGEEDLTVKKLYMVLDEVIYKDYTVGREPVVQVLEARMREERLEVRDIASAIEDIIFRGVRKGIMRQAFDFRPSNMIRNYLFDPLTYAAHYLGKAAAGTAAPTKRFFSCAAGAVRTAAKKTSGLWSAGGSSAPPSPPGSEPGAVVSA